MLRASPNGLFAQVAKVVLACPAEHMIVIVKLMDKKQNHISHIGHKCNDLQKREGFLPSLSIKKKKKQYISIICPEPCPVLTHLCIKLTTTRAWLSIYSSLFSLNLTQNLARIHLCLPVLNCFLREQLTFTIPSINTTQLVCTMQIHINMGSYKQTQIIESMQKPEMIISLYPPFTAVAEVLPTIFTHHLVATFSSGYCHVARWALLCITKYFFHTEDVIDHLSFPMLLIIV